MWKRTCPRTKEEEEEEEEEERWDETVGGRKTDWGDRYGNEAQPDARRRKKEKDARENGQCIGRETNNEETSNKLKERRRRIQEGMVNV
ncbi:hypothetical protein Pcinc_018827 [Petrolisthes cinctipes]|uniref:Uncharacterized protein n=1 Tax=Petrolisthes cinctipes TaxID=88211 RepID=A0AAE1FM47_PETCI|nr:hypothetical protein Pcinc_018827 [Petrolisthes cinctipes]